MPGIGHEAFDYATLSRDPFNGLVVPLAEYSKAKEIGFPYPGERATMTALEQVFHFRSIDALIWGQNRGLISPGSVVTIEDSLTWGCSEACEGCDDSIFILLARKQAALQRGEIWVDEQQATIQHGNLIRDLLADYMSTADNEAKGIISHALMIGGTVDNHPHLAAAVNKWLSHRFNVSVFSDFIAYVNEDGTASELFQKHVSHESGWFQRVAHHVSTDFPRGHGFKEEDKDVSLFSDYSPLPQKQGRIIKLYKKFSGAAREFKSEYGWEGMKLAIKNNVRRVVANMTIFHGNAQYIEQIYSETAALQDWARSIGSPTEVVITFSTWQWRPYIREKDNTQAHQPSSGILYEDLPIVNQAFQYMHKDTLRRITEGRPRVSAMSAGFNEAHGATDSITQRMIIEQALPYRWPGIPEMYQLTPSADVWLSPMGPGFQLPVEQTTYGGFRDREPREKINAWRQFHDDIKIKEPWYPNIVTT